MGFVLLFFTMDRYKTDSSDEHGDLGNDRRQVEKDIRSSVLGSYGAHSGKEEA